MNEHLDGEQELIVVDNALDRLPGRGGGGMEGTRSGSSAWRRTSASVPPRTAACERRPAPATVLLNPDTELLDDGLDRLADGGRRARRRWSARGC